MTAPNSAAQFFDEDSWESFEEIASIMEGNGGFAPERQTRAKTPEPLTRPCFKCGSADAKPFHKSAPYRAAKLYLCPSCIRPAQKHPADQRFDCGCTETRSATIEKHWLPPNPSCPACGDFGVGGKIRDKHSYLGIKDARSVGATTDGGERQGHTYKTEEEPILAYFPDGGWSIDRDIRSTGKRAGRPRTMTPNLEVTKIYMVDVANEIAERHKWILELEGKEFMLALDMVTNLLLARGKSANARLLAEWLPFSKNTIYRRRKKGEKMFEQLDRIEASLQRIESAQAEHAVEMFRRLYGLSEEDMEVTEGEFGLD